MDLLRHDHGLTGTAPALPARRDAARHLLPGGQHRPARPATVITREFPWCEPHADAILDLFRGYVARKREQWLLDFDDLLLGWRALLTDPTLGPALAARWDHVLVDEYQDVNQMQVDIVPAAAAGRRRADRRRRRRPGRLRLPRRGQPPPARPGRPACRRPGWSGSSRTSAPGSRCSTWPTRSGPVSGGQRLRAALDRAPAARAARLVRCHDASAEARLVVDAVLDAVEQGDRLRDQAVLMRAGAPQRPARGRADRPPGAVRQVRRAEVPGGRARQGLRRRRCGCSTTRATRSPGSGCCGCTRASARPAPGRCSTPLRPADRRASCGTPRSSPPRRAAARTALAGDPGRAGGAPGASRTVADRAAGCARPAAAAAAPPAIRDAAARLADLDRLVDAAARPPDAGRRSSPSSPSTRRPRTGDLRRPAAPRRGLPGAVHGALGQGPGVGACTSSTWSTARSRPTWRCRTDDGPGRGAAAVLRRRHPGPRRADASTPRCGCRTTGRAHDDKHSYAPASRFLDDAALRRPRRPRGRVTHERRRRAGGHGGPRSRCPTLDELWA